MSHSRKSSGIKVFFITLAIILLLLSPIIIYNYSEILETETTSTIQKAEEETLLTAETENAYITEQENNAEHYLIADSTKFDDDDTTTVSEIPYPIEDYEESKPNAHNSPAHIISEAGANTVQEMEREKKTTIVVKAGQTMRSLGKEYYGNGAFWVYIFEENRSKLIRPDAAYVGIELIIPPASKYDIDPNNKASVKKAQRLEMDIFSEFSSRND